MNEKTLLNNIQISLSNFGARLFRNNVGTAWTGKVMRPDKVMSVKVGPGDIVIRAARPLHAGLCKGSSDLVGWTPYIITEDMIGKQVAVFTALEAKTGMLKTTREQMNFITAVNQSGGRAGVVRSVADAAEVIGAV